MRISDWSSDVCSSDLFTQQSKYVGDAACSDDKVEQRFYARTHLITVVHFSLDRLDRSNHNTHQQNSTHQKSTSKPLMCMVQAPSTAILPHHHSRFPKTQHTQPAKSAKSSPPSHHPLPPHTGSTPSREQVFQSLRIQRC